MLKRICYFKTKADRRPAAGLSSANFCQFFWLFSNYHYFSSQTSEHSEHRHYYLSEKLLCPFNNFPLLCSTFISIPLFHVEWAPAGGVMCGLNKEREMEGEYNHWGASLTFKEQERNISCHSQPFVDKGIGNISMGDVRFFLHFLPCLSFIDSFIYCRIYLSFCNVKYVQRTNRYVTVDWNLSNLSDVGNKIFFLTTYQFISQSQYILAI